MKRTLFLLLLAMMPLVLLTVGAVADFFSVPSRSLPDDSGLLHRVNAQVSTTRAALRGSDEARDRLLHMDILLPMDAAGLKTLRRVSEFHTLCDAVERWNPCAEKTLGYLDLLEEFRSRDVVQLRQSIERYPTFRQEYVQVLPPDSGSVATFLEVQEEELRRRVTLAEKNVEAGKILAEARNSFEEKRYTTARDRCNQLLADYVDVLDSTVKLSLIRLKARAEVHVGTDELGEWKLQQMPKEERLQKAEEFLKAFEGADTATLTEDERRQYEAFLAEAEKLRTEITQNRTVDEVRNTANQLRGKADMPMDEFLVTAADLCRRITAQAKTTQDSTLDALIKQDTRKDLATQKRRIQADTRKRMTQLLPEVQSPYESHLQEAVHRENGLMYGYFREVREDGNIVGYKCYPTYSEAQKPTVSVGTYPAQEFTTPPQKMAELRIAENYTTLRKVLLENLGNSRKWSNFQTQCKKMQQELTDLKKKKGARAAKISLQKAIQVAEEMQGEANRKNLQVIF